jgi:hypothetical protein
LCGKRPFEGTTTRVLTSIMTKQPNAPSTIVPDVDRELERICQKAMARQQSDRYASAAELVAELEHWLNRQMSVEPPISSAFEGPFGSSASCEETVILADESGENLLVRDHNTLAELLGRIKPLAIQIAIGATTVASAFFCGMQARTPEAIPSSSQQVTLESTGSSPEKSNSIRIIMPSNDANDVQIEWSSTRL